MRGKRKLIYKGNNIFLYYKLLYEKNTNFIRKSIFEALE